MTDEFLLDHLDGWCAETGCVDRCADRNDGVEAAERGEFVCDNSCDLGVAGAEGDDFGVSQEWREMVCSMLRRRASAVGCWDWPRSTPRIASR